MKFTTKNRSNSTKLTPLICPNCGGAINPETLQCEFCGTYFMLEDKEKDITEKTTVYADNKPFDVIDASPEYVLKVVRPGVKTVGAEIVVDPYLNRGCRYSDAEIIEFAKHRLAVKLAEGIIDNLNCYVSCEQNFDGTQRVRATLRIVDPDFRF